MVVSEKQSRHRHNSHLWPGATSDASIGPYVIITRSDPPRVGNGNLAEAGSSATLDCIPKQSDNECECNIEPGMEMGRRSGVGTGVGMGVGMGRGHLRM